MYLYRINFINLLNKMIINRTKKTNKDNVSLITSFGQQS